MLWKVVEGTYTATSIFILMNPLKKQHRPIVIGHGVGGNPASMDTVLNIGNAHQTFDLDLLPGLISCQQVKCVFGLEDAC